MEGELGNLQYGRAAIYLSVIFWFSINNLNVLCTMLEMSVYDCLLVWGEGQWSKTGHFLGELVPLISACTVLQCDVSARLSAVNGIFERKLPQHQFRSVPWGSLIMSFIFSRKALLLTAQRFPKGAHTLTAYGFFSSFSLQQNLNLSSGHQYLMPGSNELYSVS